MWQFRCKKQNAFKDQKEKNQNKMLTIHNWEMNVSVSKRTVHCHCSINPQRKSFFCIVLLQRQQTAPLMQHHGLSWIDILHMQLHVPSENVKAWCTNCYVWNQYRAYSVYQSEMTYSDVSWHSFSMLTLMMIFFFSASHQVNRDTQCQTPAESHRQSSPVWTISSVCF